MYSQDQINAVAKSYSDEIVKLLEVKASQNLTIQDLSKKLIEKDKEIEKLKQQKEEVTVPSNGTTETINSIP